MMLLEHGNIYRRSVNEWGWPCLNKTLFIGGEEAEGLLALGLELTQDVSFNLGCRFLPCQHGQLLGSLQEPV